MFIFDVFPHPSSSSVIGLSIPLREYFLNSNIERIFLLGFRHLSELDGIIEPWSAEWQRVTGANPIY